MDEVLESSGAAYRSLQPPFFMENLLHQVELIRDQGMFVLAADPDAPLRCGGHRRHRPHRRRAPRRPVLERPGRTSPSASLSTTLHARWHRSCPRRSAGRSPTTRSTLADYRAQYASLGASPAIVDGMVEMAQAQAAGVYPPASGEGVGTTFRDWCESVLAPAAARHAQ